MNGNLLVKKSQFLGGVECNGIQEFYKYCVWTSQ